MPIPENVSVEAASTLPMSGFIAIEALDKLDLPSGGTLAITGGTGWLATMAIVVAKSCGLTVIAEAPEAEFARIRELGADCVVRRSDGVVDRIREITPDGVDRVLDTTRIEPPIVRAIRDGGGWVVVRNQQDETEREIVRHNIAVGNRLTDTGALETLAKPRRVRGSPGDHC